MTKIDKVIKGLECMAKRGGRCRSDCPYYKDHEVNCVEEMAADALALLKEREPRIIPFDEINNHEVLWLEVKGVETEEGLAPWVKTLNGQWFSPLFCNLERPYMILSLPDEYGKLCRCWTSRPTDEQRKAVKWDATD